MNMDIELFMAGKADSVETVDFVVSERFKDKDGKPVTWKLKAVGCKKEKEIKRGSIHKGVFDNIGYTENIAAESVLFPELGNAKLQDSYHVYGKIDLLEAMLTSGEMNRLILKSLEINGLDKDINELIKDAKN